MLNRQFEEQRKHIRVPVRIGYSLSIEGEQFKGITGNISLSGVFLETTDPAIVTSFCAKKGILRLQISQTPITIDCRVVYVGAESDPFPNGTGVEFCPSDESIISTIQSFLIEQLKTGTL